MTYRRIRRRRSRERVDAGVTPEQRADWRWHANMTKGRLAAITAGDETLSWRFHEELLAHDVQMHGRRLAP